MTQTVVEVYGVVEEVLVVEVKEAVKLNVIVVTAV